MLDWDVWTVDEVDGSVHDCRIECRKIIDVDSAKCLAFVIRGARVEPCSDPDGPTHEAAFDSFTIDGAEPTEEQSDEHYADLRAIVWDTLTES